MTTKRAAANSTLAIGGVSSPLDSFVVAESSVLRTNFCAKKPANLQNDISHFKNDTHDRPTTRIFKTLHNLST